MNTNIEQAKLELIQWILQLDSWKAIQEVWIFRDDKKKQKESLFFSLCGTWQSEENGDELAQELYNSRNDKPREVEL